MARRRRSTHTPPRALDSLQASIVAGKAALAEIEWVRWPEKGVIVSAVEPYEPQNEGKLSSIDRALEASGIDARLVAQQTRYFFIAPDQEVQKFARAFSKAGLAKINEVMGKDGSLIILVADGEAVKALRKTFGMNIQEPYRQSKELTPQS